MASAAPPSEGPYEASLHEGQVKHAVKTALACCLAAGVAYFFHLPDGQFAPVFAYLIMTLGMPSPRLNWLLTQLGIVIGAIGAALILVALHDALFLYLAVTLLWIFTVLLFSNWYPLPATLGAMVSALGIFVFFQGTVGDTLWFYVAYGLNWFIGGASVAVVDTLLWPFTTRKVFVGRLAEVYADLEQECRQAAWALRSGEPQPVLETDQEWAPFRRLRQLLAPELRRGRDTSNPFARMILACRSLNLRLRFFNQAIAPAVPFLPAQTRQQLASLLDRCAEHLHALLDGALHSKGVPSVDAGLLEEATSVGRAEGGGDVLLGHGIHTILLYRLVRDLQTATASHEALFASFRRGLAGELVALGPVATGTRLLDVHSLRASTKLVVLLLLLLLEEGLLGFPGGSQVAFYATFFASTGNLGRQNKTNLVGLAGLLGGLVYGVVAAFLTSRIPHFPLLLALVFLGEFLANLAYQRLPRYGPAGLQAGLAIPFAYLATTGPEWGSFADVRTRFAGLVVAGFTAVVVHAYLWPVLPVRQLRASIATALRATAVSLAQLFGPGRPAWEGAPPRLAETVTRARDLLDDARYLPGPEQADPAYHGILACLQEIDANLEYVHFLIGLEAENPLRQRFFQVIGDYAAQAGRNLEQVARQFQPSPSGAAGVEPVRWQPDTSGRWEHASGAPGPTLTGGIDPQRPAVIAGCLDQIAQAVERISEVAREINLRNSGC
jgi:uncharacterized membrane protein YccC